jgi:hypothetical protein
MPCLALPCPDRASGTLGGPRFKLRVLRERCKDCVCGELGRVRTCEEDDCPLWPYRMGHRPKAGTTRRTPLRALRAYCLWCCCDQPQEVRLCPSTDCPLWPWRRGKGTGETPPPAVPERRRRANGELPAAPDLAENVPAGPTKCHPQGTGDSEGEGNDLGAVPRENTAETAGSAGAASAWTEGGPRGFLSAVERACLAAGQVVGRLCPVCRTEPLFPYRHMCDRCVAEARRRTKRRAQAAWRRKRNAAHPL